ncbi:MAG: hypothetical protein LUG18_10990 [Candidatus Azobacteroides sp.]|nr:hypothetical protein [Candidatus Azobacteroides sp.]
MKGKIFTEIQFSLVTKGEKVTFWEVAVNNIPKYKKDEILYLKEPYRIENNKIFYQYETREIRQGNWKNKLFMPASAARYFIRITDIKFGSLHETCCHDCILKGLPPEKCHKNKIKRKEKDTTIWIYTFELIDCIKDK